MSETQVVPAPAADAGAGRTVIPFLSGVLLMALFGLGAVAVDTVISLGAGSYLSGGIIRMTLVFWACAGAVAGLVTGGVMLPLLFVVKGRLRSVLMPSLVAGLGFLLYAIYTRRIIVEDDSLGAVVLLNYVFLVAWAGVLAFVTAYLALAATRGGRWPFYILALTAILSSAGLSTFVFKHASAYVLCIGPLAATALGGAVLLKARTSVLRGVLALLLAALLCGALYGASLRNGTRPLEAEDRGVYNDPAKAAMAAGRPNVIIITMDTTRADHTSVCGYKYRTTPNLEALARDGQFFPYGVSTDSWTLPAHASLFTGKYSREHGARSDTTHRGGSIQRFSVYGVALAPSRLTLATYLAAKGYSTGAVVANHALLCRQWALDQGFQYYHDMPRYVDFTRHSSLLYKYGVIAVDRILGRNGKLAQSYWDARGVTRMAMRWVTRAKNAPFFLFVNYMDPHEPYSPPPPFDHMDGPDVTISRMVATHSTWTPFLRDYVRTGEGLTPELRRQVVNQYDGEIAYTDHWMGELFAWLKRQGLYDDTLIIVTSDHGECLGEHRLLDHGTSLYESVVRVPVIVKYPAGEHAGEVRDERVSLVDIFPTVFDVLKLPIPPSSGQPLSRVSHEIVAEDYASGLRIGWFGEGYRRDLTATYKDDWKYIRSSKGKVELYNLSADPGEENNLAAVDRDVAASLDGDVTSWLGRVPLFDGTKETSLVPSRELIEQLKALGYTSGTSQ